MTDSLPDSNDPLEILGVSADADARELKAAYARLIRIFRPDRSPEEFRRVHAAYESALAMLEWGVDRTDTSDAPMLDHETTGPLAGLDTVMSLAIDGRATEADQRLAELAETHPARPEAHQLRFLLAECRGAPFPDAAQHLAVALERGAPVAEWVTQVLDWEELDTFARSDACRWSVLERQESWGRYRLLGARADRFLSDSNIDALVEELLSVGYGRAARRDRLLEEMALRVACGSYWTRPGPAAVLFERFAAQSYAEGGYEFHYLARRGMNHEWTAWRDRFQGLVALSRFMRLWDVVQDETLVRVAGALAQSTAGDPVGHLRAFDALVESPRLHVHYLEGADEAAAALDLSERTTALGIAEDREIEAGLLKVNRDLGRDWLHRRGELVGTGLIVATILAAVAAPWALLPCLLALGAWFILGASRRHDQLYRSAVRERIAGLIGRRRCSPARVRGILNGMRARRNNLSEFEGDIISDRGLDALYRAVRLT